MGGIMLADIFSAFGTLGMGGIFLYLYFTERKQSSETIRYKDDKLEQNHERVLTAFQENSRAIDGLKNALDRNTEAIEKQGEIIDSLRINR